MMAARRFFTVARARLPSLLLSRHFVTPLASLPSSSSLSLSSACFSNTLYTPFRNPMEETGELIPATLDDFQPVVQISGNVYGGRDYLPSTFPHLVEGPGVQGFVYKVHGEVVAFFSSVLVDRGQTVLFMTARVKDSLRGQGLFSRVRQERVRLFSNRSLFPKLRREVCVTSYPRDTDGFRLVMKRQRTFRAFEAASLRQLTLQSPRRSVSTLHTGDVAQLFGSDAACWSHLFPHKYFIVGVWPYTVVPDNLAVIQNAGWSTQFYGTKSDNGDYTMLSAGGYYVCSMGIAYQVDIFGDEGIETADVSYEEGRDQPGVFRRSGKNGNSVSGRAKHVAVKDHVITHLQRLQDISQKFTGKMMFRVVASDTLEDVLDDVTQRAVTINIVEGGDVFKVWEKDI